MVCSSVESAEVIATCDAKKHATLHNRYWWLIHSVIRRIRLGKISALTILINLLSNISALDLLE